MNQPLPARQTTQFSPNADGPRLAPWNSVRWSSAAKVCECCGKEFRPWTKQRRDGKLTVQKENLWLRQRFCSISCSKIHSNCMRSSEVRERVSTAMKARGHRPPKRGGNGQITTQQRNLLTLLGAEWIAEFPVPVRQHRRQRLPKHLKIDVANPSRKIAIELDGHSHQSPTRRLQDSRKSNFLAQNGWCVFRITNQRAEELSTTCTSPDTLLTSLTAPLFITVI